jgi:hypothetical protein
VEIARASKTAVRVMILRIGNLIKLHDLAKEERK